MYTSINEFNNDFLEIFNILRKKIDSQKTHISLIMHKISISEGKEKQNEIANLNMNNQILGELESDFHYLENNYTMLIENYQDINLYGLLNTQFDLV